MACVFSLLVLGRSSLSPDLYKPTFAGFVETDDLSSGKIALRSLVRTDVSEANVMHNCWLLLLSNWITTYHLTDPYIILLLFVVLLCDMASIYRSIGPWWRASAREARRASCHGSTRPSPLERRLTSTFSTTVAWTSKCQAWLPGRWRNRWWTAPNRSVNDYWLLIVEVLQFSPFMTTSLIMCQKYTRMGVYRLYVLSCPAKREIDYASSWLYNNMRWIKGC